MDFHTLVGCLGACTLLSVLGGAWLAMVFWLSCDLRQEQKTASQRQLEVVRQDRAKTVGSIMELEVALRAARCHVEQLQRKLALLKLPTGGVE